MLSSAAVMSKSPSSCPSPLATAPFAPPSPPSQSLRASPVFEPGVPEEHVIGPPSSTTTAFILTSDARAFGTSSSIQSCRTGAESPRRSNRSGWIDLRRGSCSRTATSRASRSVEVAAARPDGARSQRARTGATHRCALPPRAAVRRRLGAERPAACVLHTAPRRRASRRPLARARWRGPPSSTRASRVRRAPPGWRFTEYWIERDVRRRMGRRPDRWRLASGCGFEAALQPSDGAESFPSADVLVLDASSVPDPGVVNVRVRRIAPLLRPARINPRGRSRRRTPRRPFLLGGSIAAFRPAGRRVSWPPTTNLGPRADAFCEAALRMRKRSTQPSRARFRVRRRIRSLSGSPALGAQAPGPGLTATSMGSAPLGTDRRPRRLLEGRVERSGGRGGQARPPRGRGGESPPAAHASRRLPPAELERRSDAGGVAERGEETDPDPHGPRLAGAGPASTPWRVTGGGAPRAARPVSRPSTTFACRSSTTATCVRLLHAARGLPSSPRRSC